jgi:hypothetical protein
MRNGFSLRTLMLTVFGFALILGLFTSGGMAPIAAHTVLVLAFAVPGGSIGYDLGRTSRSTAVGICLASVAGTLALGGAVLLVEWWALLR